MTETHPCSGALTARDLKWGDIDWRAVETFVRRLQMRIAKAYREKRYGRAQALQRLLTHSFYAKLLAIKRVTQNKGSRTPGIDNVVWNTPQQKIKAANSLKRRGYQTRPLRRIYIPKKQKGKRRPLSIPVMKCRAQQALYLLALEPISETIAERHAYGFRPLRSTMDAAERCWFALHRPGSAQWILEGDIQSCFDTISHDWLLQHVPIDKWMLKQWLAAGYMEKGRVYPTESGTPQGGIISPTLLNITLCGLEQAIKEQISQRNDKVHVCIYADDFIITGARKEVLVEKVLPTVEYFLKERGLILAREKTKITHIDEGFDFLGYHMRKYNGRFLTIPAKQNVKSFLQNVRETIKTNATAKTENLIRQLNPKIRGWGNYHRHICAKKTYNHVSHHIFSALWNWSVRRHPNKGARWIMRKYFRSKGLRNWVFSVKIKDKSGNFSYLDLIEIDNIRIRRHIKIIAEATPYDPQYDEYFYRRQRHHDISYSRSKRRK